MPTTYRMRKLGPQAYVAEKLVEDVVVESLPEALHPGHPFGTSLVSLQMIAKRHWWPQAASKVEKQAITQAFTGDDNCEGCGE